MDEIKLTINGQEITAKKGMTVLEVAREAGELVTYRLLPSQGHGERIKEMLYLYLLIGSYSGKVHSLVPVQQLLIICVKLLKLPWAEV